jgi:hypothetical protein
VALYTKASDDGAVQVHLGANFPLTLTAQSATVDGKEWFEAIWQTPSRKATGWLPASVVTRTKPTGAASAGFDALDTALYAYLASFGKNVGVQAFDVTRGVTYTYNSTLTFFVASSMKVPIMLAFLAQLEAKGKEPTATENWLLATMIENSRNSSAESLYKAIGYQAGMNAFTKKFGISGLTPGKPGWWGHSTMSPATMVALLTKLNEGTIVNYGHRALALNLMQHVQADQRAGVGDASPKEATVAMKVGYVAMMDGSGLYVYNSSGIVTLGAETYIISVYTDHDRSFGVGERIVNRVCGPIAKSLLRTP